MKMNNYYQQERPGMMPKPQKNKELNVKNILYVGELPPDMDEYELDTLIKEKCGITADNIVVKKTRDTKSFAYAKMSCPFDVEKACKVLHLYSVRNYNLRVQPFSQKENQKSKMNPHCNLFVKNLPNNAKSNEICSLFSQYGKVTSFRLKQSKEGVCLGYGYVQFEEQSEAELAMSKLNNYEYNGKMISVDNFSKADERGEEEKFPIVFIQQLPPSIANDKDLNSFFSRFGKITYCTIIENKTENNQGINMGMILYNKREDAHHAVRKLNNETLPGDNSGVKILLTMAPSQGMIDRLMKSRQEDFKTKYSGCNLIVRNIPDSFTEKELRALFGKYGDVVSARVPTHGVFKDKIRNGEVVDKEFIYVAKGYGYICLKTQESASKAQQEMTGYIVTAQDKEFKLAVEFFNYDKAEIKGKKGKKPSIKGPNDQQGVGSGNRGFNEGKKNNAGGMHKKKNYGNQGNSGHGNPGNNNRDQHMYNNMRQGGMINPNMQGMGQMGGPNPNPNMNMGQMGGPNPNPNMNMGQMGGPNPYMKVGQMGGPNPNLNMNIGQMGGLNSNMNNLNVGQPGGNNPNMGQMGGNSTNNPNMGQTGGMNLQHNRGMGMMNQGFQGQGQIGTQIPGGYPGQQQDQPKQSNNPSLQYPPIYFKINEALALENEEEKQENIGECLYYYILDLIVLYKLDEGIQFNAETICSKLTGVVMRMDENDLLRAVISEEKTVKILQDIIKKIFAGPSTSTS